MRNNQKLTSEDVAAIEALVFGENVVSGDKPPDVIGDEGPLPKFVRKVLGLDKEAAKAAFIEIFGMDLSAKQLVFMGQLIDF